MSTAFYPTSASFKPQVLSRQEGFHLPSPTPSTPTSTDGNPSNNRNANNSSPISTNAFDTHNLFISPPSYLSVPETFRKFPSSDNVHGPSMDFSEELASLIAHPHPSSHERSTQSPANAYDDYRTSTHNIFDISAPTSHHHHPHSPHSPYPSGQSAFSLPPTSALTHHSLHSPSTSLHTPTHSLHEFTTHAHFNSTVPAIGSSMRYEPQPHTTHNQNGSAHPFALNTSSSNNNVGGEPSSVNSFTSHMSSLSAYSNLSSATNGPNDFSHLHQTRQTPSPVLPPPTPISTTSRNDNFSRSRSRSRSSVSTQPINPANPPSTNGGPTRRTRPKRGSVSSVSPPPLHRGHITQPLVIPGSANAGPGSARSPLSLHTSGWFGMGPSGTAGSLGNGNMGVAGGMGGEFSLPTPESVHGGFASFGSASILSGSPKDLNMNGMLSGAMSVNGAKGDSPPADMAAKQAMIANEKRRRRRESHNAVERRRRDNINEKISELATLIPECLLDPNATLTMPPTLSSATNEDLLFGVSSPVSPSPSNSVAKQESKDNDAEDKDGTEQGGVVKANKGMILRKSVEYIRYLQQLVSAQATRNRDLEQQLHSFRGSSGSSSSGMLNGNGTNPEDEMLMLHEEVGDFNLVPSLGMHNGGGGNNHSHSRKRFSGFELESVAEMDQDTEHGDHNDEDHDMERPSTSGTGASPLSEGTVSDEQDGEDGQQQQPQEEERGRKGRDGRPMGLGGAMKTEEGMETS